MVRLFRSEVLAVMFALAPAWSSIECQTITRHPTPENLKLEGPYKRVRMRDTVSGLRDIDNIASRLRRSVLIDSIGRLDGPVETAMGMITSVAVDASGRILVLDRANLRLRVFDASGDPAFAFGQKGSGPIDLRSPLGVWTSGTNEVVIADRVLGVKFFTLNSKQSPVLRKTISVVSPMAVCGAGGVIVSLSPTMEVKAGANSDVEQMIRVYDSTGRTNRVFGKSYRSSTPLVRMMMSEGVIGCGESGIVLLALSKLPFVYGYDVSGKLKWSLRLSDFVVGTSIEQRTKSGQPSIGLDPENPTTSFTHQITHLEKDLFLVQVGLMTPESIRDRTLWSRVDSYLIDANTGSAVYVGSRLPAISALWHGRLYGFTNDPFPQVRILGLPSS